MLAITNIHLQLCFWCLSCTSAHIQLQIMVIVRSGKIFILFGTPKITEVLICCMFHRKMFGHLILSFTTSKSYVHLSLEYLLLFLFVFTWVMLRSRCDNGEIRQSM